METTGVLGRVPRKQGLKLIHVLMPPSCYPGPRPSSTKTRIETLLAISRRVDSSGPRPSSTKTRIETSKIEMVRTRVCRVLGRVPRKQGLKPGMMLMTFSPFNVLGRVPRKQGLKLGQQGRSGPPKFSPRPSSTKTRIETWFPRLSR